MNLIQYCKIKKEKTCLPIYRVIPDDLNVSTTDTEKPEKIKPLNAESNPICHSLALLGAHLIFHISRIRVKQVERPGDQGQQDVESGDKNCAHYNGCIRNNYKGMRSEPSVAPRPPVSHRAIDHTNEHSIQHL